MRKGDTLPKIAKELGDYNFWKALYRANSKRIKNTEFIKPGIVLTIPPSITGSPNFAYFNGKESLSDSTLAELEKGKQNTLDEFRTMFSKVVEQNKEKTTKENKAEQIDPVLELEGLVLDETRSKMGRDFYDLFYQNWEAPEDATNFTITISEQPSFGRGTQVTIKIDYEQIFSARLQPRYEYIEAVSQQAVARCQNIIQKQASVREQLMGF